MKRMMAWACLSLFASAPLQAQDETPPADTAAEPAADAAATDASSTDSSSTDSAASDSSSSEASSSESADASSSETSESSESADSGESAFPPIYVGVEWDTTKIEVTNDDKQAALGGRRFSSDFYKLRLGARVFEGVGFELQAGIPGRKGDLEDRDFKTKEFYGAYIVPTGVAFELIEISARVGYSYMKLGANGESDSVDGVSYGLALELPIRNISEGLPNVRVTSGGTVYQQDHDTRSYGWFAGLRYDFGA